MANFLRYHLGYTYASSVLLEPISRRFTDAIRRFAAEQGVPLVHFEKGQRKDDVAKEHWG